MQRITLGLNEIVRVPGSWTCFAFGRFLYGKDETGRWIVVGTLPEVLAKKTA